jgi:hypothetical protein
MVVKHQCKICLKVFNHKSNYVQHLEKIKPCVKPEPIETIAVEQLTDLQCCSCFKSFINKSSRTRHETTSKCFLKKIKMDEEQQEKENQAIKKLQEDNKQMAEKLKELEEIVKSGAKSSTNNNNSHNNSHNTNNIQNNNYTVNMYGKEDVSHITDAQIMKVISQGYRSVPAYILLKYFSDEMPGNSNVCNTNIKSPYILVFNGKKWELKDKKDMIEQMYGCNFDELEEKFHEFKDTYKMKENSIAGFLNYINEGYAENIVGIISKDINKLLYNERDKSLKNKKIEKQKPTIAVADTMIETKPV